MPITFHPHPGTVLICDFSTGFQPPEMVKRRHVVVVSPRRRHRSGLCLVVPFSTVAPDPVEAFHHVIPVGTYPFFHPQKDVWAKGDMLTCVACRRLDRVLLNGRYVAPGLRPDDFAAVQRAILAALEIHTHTPWRWGMMKMFPLCRKASGLQNLHPGRLTLTGVFAFGWRISPPPETALSPYGTVT